MFAISAQVAMAQENNATNITESNVTSDSPTIYSNSTAVDSPSMTPSTILPTSSIAPTINYDEICPNSVDWKRLGRPWESITEWQKQFTCDDDKVSCSDFGSLGRASLHCCKCRPICCGRCNVPCNNDDGTADTNPPNIAQPSSQISPSTAPVGYKYNFKDTKSSSSSWKLRPGPRHFALLIVVFFISVIFCCNREQRTLRRTRRTMSQRRRQQQQQLNEDGGADDAISEERYQLFLSKFHFETVPPPDGTNKSNKVESLYNPDRMVRENSTTSSKVSSIADKSSNDGNDEEIDENYRPKLQDVEIGAPPPDSRENTLKSVNSSVSSACCSTSYQPFASLKRIPARGECSICLDGYHPGDTVCIAVNEACNHVYHQECVVEWLKTNGRCPLCRVDLMK
ncbi:unnamed protein product [Cylindrotheca closterium]|uniref:RING-type domain-containing protein n=1 Tax=Cylindrotheca closterium TaxID=2856 RepID=A0AAD2JJT2_9STRA|nr:unnamed protein product [Cylindrotheca closterium]